MEIGKAEPADLEEIYQIMRQAAALLENRDWYCIDTKEYIETHIADAKLGQVWKAEEQGQTAAFFLVHYPENPDTNMGHHLGLSPEELDRVAYMDSLAVCPAFRGRGLQFRLMQYGEEQLALTSRCHLMGTVHPDNVYSLNNFLKLGYKIIDTLPMYGSLPRHIMYKHIQPAAGSGHIPGLSKWNH